METVSEAAATTRKSADYRAILFGGLLAGAMDLSAAFISNGLRGGSPLKVMQSISSGLLGAESFTGGAQTATLGVFLHFIIAFVWAIIFYIASRRIKFLTAQPIISGVLYGGAVYLLMYYLIVPLSAAPFKMRHTFDAIAVDLFIHIICVGLPIALVNSRFSK